MELIRGRWYKKYINCPEDKRDFDILRRGYCLSHEVLAQNYCSEFCVPDISEEEKNAITEYWSKFGISVTDYSWHRMYYHVTGIHDVRFVPDPVVGLCVYAYYNDRGYEDAWRDKNMFERLLPAIPFPTTLGKRIRGRFFVPKEGYLPCGDESEKMFASLIYDLVKRYGYTHIIIKNTRDTGFGKNVGKYRISCVDDVLKALDEWSARENFIVQECIRQHDILASFNNSSTNMLRICSWRHGNKVDIMFAAVRCGIDGFATDVVFVNGKELVNLVGISKDGILDNKMLNQDGQFVRELPAGVKIPSWDKIVDIIKSNHLLLDNFDFVGWDFTIDSTGEPRCFEWNISWPGSVLYQYVNGPLYGDMTEEVFAFLNDEKNRDNYIPYYMRAKKK